MIYKFCFFILIFYVPFSIAKYQVCSITINSADEIETFKEFLPKEDFNFIELLPSQFNKEQNHSTHWFNSVCETRIKCDILVISGHFGGTFFGESGYALPTELLEEKACQNNCSGILSHVKEIFLFGCNTLAGKKKDSRSYQEYLQVLLDDNMAREMAERVVAARYSPLETPFFKRMNFIFSGSETIYGFDQLSPLGRHIRKPLQNYFRAINKNFGSYTRYLDTKAYKRDRNRELFQSLYHTTLNQAHLSLSQETESQKKFFQNKCLLYNDQSLFDKRIRALLDVFESNQAGSAFFAMDHFLENQEEEIVEGRGRSIFRFIRKNESFKKNFLSYYKHLNFLPYIKLVYLKVLERFFWVDAIQLKFLRKKDLLELIKVPNPEAYISLLLLIQDKQIQPDEVYISTKDLPKNYVKNLWGLLIFEKIKSIDTKWQKEILDYCDKNIKNNHVLCYQVLNTLAHIQPQSDIVEKTKYFLDHKDTGLIYYTIRMMGQSGVKDYTIHKKISSFLTHSDSFIQLEALEALGFLSTPYSDIQNQISELLITSNKNQAKEIFWSLSRMDLKEDLVQKRVFDFVFNPSHENDEIESLKLFFEVLKNTSYFSDFILDFLYTSLESRENLNFLYELIQQISLKPKIKDLGIHYRLLLFRFESKYIKEEVLRRMNSLIWLHPEVQLSFLVYLKDSSPKIRALAIKILMNIENLQEKVLREIYHLYQKENRKDLQIFFN